MPHIAFVPTPIGNLEDITLRGLRLLKEADLIAAEDTRTTGILLKHYEIHTPQLALHQHNEHKRIPQLLDRLQNENLNLAVVSDAGTPGISDPGFLLVREAIAREIPIEVLPGATALIPAVVASGLPCDRFIFEGFLPLKKGRQTRLEQLQTEVRTMIFYESPHRLVKTLGQMAEMWGSERPASVSRELSKLHETHVRGTLSELHRHFSDLPAIKGECVIVIQGRVD